jgi:hypothetical protein
LPDGGLASRPKIAVTGGVHGRILPQECVLSPAYFERAVCRGSSIRFNSGLDALPPLSPERETSGAERKEPKRTFIGHITIRQLEAKCQASKVR